MSLQPPTYSEVCTSRDNTRESLGTEGVSYKDLLGCVKLLTAYRDANTCSNSEYFKKSVRWQLGYKNPYHPMNHFSSYRNEGRGARSEGESVSSEYIRKSVDLVAAMAELCL